MNHGLLKVELAARDGLTFLAGQEQVAPLKVMRPLERHQNGGTELELCIMDASPGLLGGDTSRVDIHCRSGARATVTTQGFSRVHPCPSLPARMRVQLNLEAGSRLFYLPEAVSLFQEAHLEARLHAEVAPGACLVAMEGMAAGRVAHGEKFQFLRYAARTHLRHGVNWALCAQNVLEPQEMEYASAYAWGTCTHTLNLYAVYNEVDRQWQDAVRAVLEEQMPRTKHVMCAGVSALPHGGVAVSLMGQRAHDLRALALQITALWEQLALPG